ncbi:alpha-ketoacid dehydrogenase subunit alpha/beta [Rhodohalobacter barkolensis]|uniref:3-methyl-2-oxobutanoate dehydrogenase (2-methylpropanoyl-transferring) n=1 Tax=Rhodohalobacter barkolensis TaxID=2053187 RepID=A0A2N0VIG1_9BACT|nr:transketolase C-terminal domain-containing protein [Rhodohalobacter barkolensis]PKD43908.1 pyruvate dehydrogenase [Rhodohalobacter barkolensis]
MAKKKDAKKKIDWLQVADTLLLSRAIDDLEEAELVPDKKILYQFSARGHELGQILLGMQLDQPNDAASAYYRSRPLMLTLGLSAEDAIASGMAKSGGYSDGRDIGVVCNMPGNEGVTVLPMAGDVGSQYTPAAGWAQAIEYRKKVLKEEAYSNAISVILGGDASVATNGFWSCLTMATTLNLPILFYIEDNGYGISVTSDMQTPGANIANNLYSFKNLRIFDGDGTSPEEALALITEASDYTRERKGPALLRLTVPRLNGHSYQDNQAYKDEELLKKESDRDPLKTLKEFMIPDLISKKKWDELEEKNREKAREAADSAWNRPDPDKDSLTKYAFFKEGDEIQQVGGLFKEGFEFPDASEDPSPEKQRINIVEGVRRTLEHELDINEKVVVFGEDVGAKGGVHAATMGLQTKFGEERVFDTSLSEEGIIGRAVGLAYAGLMPVAEIQFRKYADPATEQLKNTGTIRWRTANKFAAPMVVRMPGGFAKCGDPWHSESNEVFFAHMIGWQVAYPSNAQDAVGLLRSAMRSNNPTIFFEHRNLLDSKYARKPYPGDDFIVPFGKANRLREGEDLTIITWGAMCERCEAAADESDISMDIIDLRTIMPWDKEAVFESVKKTNRCLIVHEDSETAGFGAELGATISNELFRYLDAPVQRLTMPDIPMPYNVELMNHVLPSVEKIVERADQIVHY